jgi:hypothetical protein
LGHGIPKKGFDHGIPKKGFDHGIPKKGFEPNESNKTDPSAKGACHT